MVFLSINEMFAAWVPQLPYIANSKITFMEDGLTAVIVECIDGWGFTDGTENKTSMFNASSNMWMMENMLCESMNTWIF